MTKKARETNVAEEDGLPVESKAPRDPVETRPLEEWRAEKSTPEWLFAAAKMMHAWPIGLVLSESDYDAAIDAAAHVRISGHRTTPIRRKRK